MTTLHTPFFMESVSGDADITYSGAELRNYLRAVLGVIDGFQGRRGIVDPASLLVTAGTGFSVNISGGKALVTDTDITNGGSAVVWSDGTFNVTTPSAPSTGTQVHRIIARLRNKLENGLWSTYDWTPDIVPDTGSGLQPEPASSITLATVAIPAGAASVTGAMITDYRELAGKVIAYRSADLARQTGTMSTDSQLTLANLAAGATYDLAGTIVYTAPASITAPNTTGDFKMSWSAAGCSALIGVTHENVSQSFTQLYAGTDASTTSCAGQGATPGQLMFARVGGTITTTAAPASLALKWAQDTLNTIGGNVTTVKAGSLLVAKRTS